MGAADPALALMLLLTRDAALRAATAYSVAPANIVANRIVASTKNEGQVDIPMSARLEALVTAAVSRATDTRQPLVLAMGLRSNGKTHPINIGNTLRHRLGSAQKRVGAGNWTWHDLRRTAAQRVYRATGNLQVPMALLGHKSMLTTLKYLNAQRPRVTDDIVALFASTAPTEKHNDDSRPHRQLPRQRRRCTRTRRQRVRRLRSRTPGPNQPAQRTGSHRVRRRRHRQRMPHAANGENAALRRTNCTHGSRQTPAFTRLEGRNGMSTTTPITQGRVRHQPTPREPGIPATMRVAVEVGFVQSCPDCRAIVADLARSCISDATVTAFRAVPGRKHAHEVTEGSQALPGLTATVPVAPEAISDTNGSAPDDVLAALEADDPYFLANNAPEEPGRFNGFDPPGRD
jgi:hypothetical protein